VEHEQLFPGHQTYARYLHVAEAVVENEVQAAWDGLGGRLKALRREVVDVKAGQAKLEAGQAEAKADVADVKADVAEVKADVSEVKADVSDTKTLLKNLVPKVCIMRHKSHLCLCECLSQQTSRSLLVF
jgi:septal ring factor EnvC (AmiA/AmiB activator)